MDETVATVAEVLHDAGETHHVVWKIVDGDDPDWASWYSEWLLSLSRLPELLGSKPVRSELTWMLVQLARDYESSDTDQRWEDFYAERIVTELGA
jgi:hypothetical protein